MSSLSEFFDELMADVVAEATRLGDPNTPESAFKEVAFTRILLEDLEAAGALESPAACFFASTSGRHPFKVNGYGLPEEDTRLDLVIADFRPADDIQKCTGADVDRSFKQALRFLEFALENGAMSTDPGHEEHGMLSEIFEKKSAFDRVRVTLITNAVVAQRKEKERREQVGEHRIIYDIWDLERLRRFRSSGATHEPIEVSLGHLAEGGVRCVPSPDGDLGYQTCVAIFPGQVLHDLYDEYGARLLELNVRSYLQARGKINREILETLLSSPKLFLAYNNGITIVAERIDLDRSGTLITSISGLQIVNGGQTTASIHRARKDSSADLSHVYVQAKITVVPMAHFEAMVPEISRLSNTQNKVTTVDLGANHAFHIGVERVARRTWAPGEQSMWFYERARGAFQTERSRDGVTAAQRAKFDLRYPVSQRITKEELARYSNAWNAYPHVVSRGGQKNFEKFMSGIATHAKGWEPAASEYKSIVGKAILFRGTQLLARELGIRAFAINIVTYTVSLVAYRTARRIDLQQLWAQQRIPSALAALIREWLPLVSDQLLTSAGDRNPGEWFKSEQCWVQLLDVGRSWPLPDDVATALTSVGEEFAAVASDVQTNIARCLEVDAQTWLKVQLWGSESGRLLPWQIGIANTLGGYSAQNWARKPSEKQAKHAVLILELFAAAHRDG